MLEICDDKRITLPLFLFTHAGVLTSLFNEAGYPIKFLLAVIGETNSRKTSLSLCMTKLFNRKDIHTPEASFNSTEGGIEKKVSMHPDAVLVIDDFMPASTKSKQRILDTKLEKIVRMYGDRKGIDRMTDFSRNPNAGYYPVKGIAVITGEHFRGVPSSMTRNLIINNNKTSVNNEKLQLYQRTPQILSTHIYDFLRYITQNYEYVEQFINQKVPEYRAKNIFDPLRYTEMYAILMTTVEIFLQYAISKKFIGMVYSQNLYSEWETTIRTIIYSNIHDLKENNFGVMLSRVCQSIIMDKEMYPLPGEERINYGDQVFEDSTYFYIRLDTFLKEIRRYFQVWGVEYPSFSKKNILDELEKNEIIEMKGKLEGKRTLKLPGSKKNKQRFLFIKKQKIEEILNLYGED